MNEEQFEAYLDKVQRGEQTSEQERYQAMMFLNSGLSPQSSDSYGLEGGMDQFDTTFALDPDRNQKLSNAYGTPQRMSTPNVPLEESLAVLDPLREQNKPRTTVVPTQRERERQPFDPNDMPFLNPGGSDLTTKANMFGSSLENPAFKGAGVVAGLSLGMGLTREILGGVGGARQQSYINNYYRDKQRSNEYNTISASGTTNTIGGSAIGVGQFGGEFDGQDFQGQQEQPMQEEQANEMQQMQQIVQVVAGALQQGAQPQEVVQMLMQQGMPQEQAVAVVEEVMMQMQGGGQQEQQMMQQGQPQMQDQQMMKYGGKKVGDLVSFKYGGKKVSGRIKKIENGKIYV